MREPIWTIRANWRASYFVLFSIQSIVGTGLLLWYEVTQRTSDVPIETVLAIIQGIAWVGAASATTSIAITEGMQSIMVTGEWLRQNLLEPLKEKQRQEGREQGREEERQVWKAWNQRRLDAEAKGETFDEPIPESQNGPPKI